MLKFEQTFEFTLILRIFRHFTIIKIVMHLEVLLQNVKRPKSGRNSGHVRNSGNYGTILEIFLSQRWKKIYGKH
jgi:hypothetical protein